MGLLVRFVIIMIALLAAVVFVPGIRVAGDAWAAIAVMAVVLALVNAVVRPMLKSLGCGLIVLTLGLFLLVINAATFWLASYIAVNVLNIGFYVDGFVPALLGSLLVSAVSFVLSLFVRDDKRR